MEIRVEPIGCVRAGREAAEDDDGTPVVDLEPVMREFLPREPIRQPPWSTELMRHYWERQS